MSFGRMIFATSTRLRIRETLLLTNSDGYLIDLSTWDSLAIFMITSAPCIAWVEVKPGMVVISQWITVTRRIHSGFVQIDCSMRSGSPLCLKDTGTTRSQSVFV